MTATGDQQHPVQNTIGRAIVEAVVRAGKEGRKFRVMVVIPSIPGFAGDLRESAAAGTRAIMDYQYKSILRGSNSIFEQVRAQGVDPRGIYMTLSFSVAFLLTSCRAHILLQSSFLRQNQQNKRTG